jgi:hypothetical protein
MGSRHARPSRAERPGSRYIGEYRDPPSPPRKWTNFMSAAAESETRAASRIFRGPGLAIVAAPGYVLQQDRSGALRTGRRITGHPTARAGTSREVARIRQDRPSTEIFQRLPLNDETVVALAPETDCVEDRRARRFAQSVSPHLKALGSRRHALYRAGAALTLAVG